MKRLLLVIGIVATNSAFAFDYFESKIEYWNSHHKKESRANANVEKNKSKKKSNNQPEFDWNSQLDPGNDEFFREGDYLPPKPFMEVVRNPSDENIKNWFALMEKKNKLRQGLEANLRDYLKKNRTKMEEQSIALVNANLSAVQVAVPDHKRYRFRLYFHSACPHCRRMIKTMTKLQERGFYVEVKQIDENKKAVTGLMLPVVKATTQELKEKGINSWPVLFAADLEKKAVYRINGYQNVNQIYQILRRSDGQNIQ